MLTVLIVTQEKCYRRYVKLTVANLLNWYVDDTNCHSRKMLQKIC